MIKNACLNNKGKLLFWDTKYLMPVKIVMKHKKNSFLKLLKKVTDSLVNYFSFTYSNLCGRSRQKLLTRDLN